MIYFEKENQTFYLESKDVTYAFRVHELGFLNHLYYGKRIPREDLAFSVFQADRGHGTGLPYGTRRIHWTFTIMNVLPLAEAIIGKVCLRLILTAFA